VGLALFCLAAIGCGAMEQERAEKGAPTANAAGTWTGWAGEPRVSRPVTLTLEQSGTNVKGDLAVAGRPDLSGPVTGTVQGELVYLSLATRTFAQMRIQQDTMSGEGSGGAGQPSSFKIALGRVAVGLRCGRYQHGAAHEQLSARLSHRPRPG
jgi:hypothetical protein